MSYEGSIQCFCENNHYWEQDESYTDSTKTCPYCDSHAVISNSIDETNGDDYGRIDHTQFQISPDRTNTSKSSIAGKLIITTFHIVATYRIPTQSEIQSLRTYRDENNVLCFINTKE